MPSPISTAATPKTSSAASRRPSPTTRRPSSWTPRSPTTSTTAARPTTTRASTIWPSPTTPRPSSWMPATPGRSITAACPSPTRATTGAPLPISTRRSSSRPTTRTCMWRAGRRTRRWARRTLPRPTSARRWRSTRTARTPAKGSTGSAGEIRSLGQREARNPTCHRLPYWVTALGLSQPTAPTDARSMSHSTFGHLFRVTTWGESHGPAIGCVVDGCPPGIPISDAEIQADLDKRRPGQSRFTTQRKEPDQVRILSGVFTDEAGEQVTTGTPIALEIENVDARSKNYGDIKDKFRPGHADNTYLMKYGFRDWRGSGRASARATACRVAAGAIARKVVPGLRVRGALTQIGPYEIDRRNWNWDEIGNNPFFCPDARTARVWADFLDQVRKKGSSTGAIIEVIAEGVPPGLGAPLYAKLDQDIASALMSINAVKGVEIG